MSDSFSHFTSSMHCYFGQTHQVFQGGKGPIVILLHEMPNPYPENFDFGYRLIQAGYQVFMPVLFGIPNQAFSNRNAIKNIAKACIQKEFAVFSKGQSSPITDWLRAFCQQLLKEQQQSQLGMIGMCFTGNFALAFLAEPWMVAPVLSQPSLPYGISHSHQKGLHVSDAVLQQAKQRPDLEVLGFRFTEDWMCPKRRFDALKKALPNHFTGIEIDNSKGNPHGIQRMAHSVFTKDFVDQEGHPTHQAWLTLLAFLEMHLPSTLPNDP